MLGFSLSLMVPFTFVITSELIPNNLRGRSFILVISGLILGHIYGCLLNNYFMQDLVHGNWKAVILCISIPILVTLFLVKLFLKDTPRYLLSEYDILDCVRELNIIGKKNDNNF